MRLLNLTNGSVPYLGQQHGQSHDEVLRQFVFIVDLSLPLLSRQHLDREAGTK